jgi:UDP-glucose 4-epimerase
LFSILILGSRGFIGKHLVEKFSQIGAHVVGCDLSEFTTKNYKYYKLSVTCYDFEEIFKSHKFTFCINASGSGDVGFSMKNPTIDFQSNTLSVSKILDAIRNFQPFCKYIHISSAAVYGNPIKLPIIESDYILPLSPYGFHKWMSEILCKEYASLYGLSIAIIRPFSVFGEGLKKQLLWDICTKLQNSDNITLYGTGEESRDFIHIKDLINCVMLIISNCKFNCDIFNIATGKQITIRKVATLFEKYYPGNKKIQFSGELKDGDPSHWHADIGKISKLGFFSENDFENSLCNYIFWYIKNFNVK